MDGAVMKLQGLMRMMGNADPIICDALSYLHGLHGRAVLPPPRMNGPSENCDFGEIDVLTLSRVN